MTTISKILTVVITVFSLFFLGFASVISVSGRNWESEMNQLPQFTFTLQEGEQPTWTSTDKLSGTPVATSQYLPEVVLKSWQKLQQDRQAEIQDLQEQIDKLEPQISKNKALIESDLKALKEKFNLLIKEKEEIKTVTGQVDAKLAEINQETEKVQELITKRREDVQRLARILQGIRTEHTRLLEDKRTIEQSIIRLQGSIAKAERRSRQLQSAGLTVSSTAKAAKDSETGTIK